MNRLNQRRAGHLAIMVAAVTANCLSQTAQAQQGVVCQTECTPWQEIGQPPALLEPKAYLPMLLVNR